MEEWNGVKEGAGKGAGFKGRVRCRENGEREGKSGRGGQSLEGVNDLGWDGEQI